MLAYPWIMKFTRFRIGIKAKTLSSNMSARVGFEDGSLTDTKIGNVWIIHKGYSVSSIKSCA